MPQRRPTEFNTADKSFDNNIRSLVGVPPGLYYGFDAALPASMTLTLSQSTTGITIREVNNATSGPWGLVLSRQGVAIFESDLITLNINTTTISGRRDAIVCNHEYEEVTGGVTATYSVKQNIGAGEPTLTDTEVLIGILELPVSCTALNQTGVNYIDRRIKDLKALRSLIDGLTEALPLKYDKLQPPAIALTFATGWAIFSAGYAGVRKSQSNIITFEGGVKVSTVSATQLICTLPTEYRPGVPKPLGAVLRIDISNTFIPCVIVVQTNGQVSLSNMAGYTLAVNDEIYLEGLNFIPN